MIASFILLPTLLVFGEEEYVETVYLTKMEALKLAFPNTRLVKKKKVWLSEAQREAISSILEEDYDERRLTWYIGLDEKKSPWATWWWETRSAAPIPSRSWWSSIRMERCGMSKSWSIASRTGGRCDLSPS
ncbi:hypothetical protein NITGR_950050 [Nitrospina gracilis 3/211]|uniref:Uncharacterized protein n=1 Tax=Nitrospina gracilis (strain 3/211) TaxID=1266370 RepID=M1ZES5_NITG3|nr:hypothetical protein NITGR_950050 [Nitrospina gracilis 3/211]